MGPVICLPAVALDVENWISRNFQLMRKTFSFQWLKITRIIPLCLTDYQLRQALKNPLRKNPLQLHPHPKITLQIMCDIKPSSAMMQMSTNCIASVTYVKQNLSTVDQSSTSHDMKKIRKSRKHFCSEYRTVFDFSPCRSWSHRYKIKFLKIRDCQTITSITITSL